MKNTDAQNKVDSNKESGSNRLPVPHYIRTKRTLPRIIAAVTLVVWLTATGLGSNALAKREASNTSPLDELLREPESSWGISFESAENAPCAGIISAQFNPGQKPWPDGLKHENHQKPSKTPYLRFEGAFRFIILGRNGVATFDFDAKFTGLDKLSEFQATVVAGSGKLLVDAPSDNSLIHIAVQTDSKERKISLARPEPVLLIEKNRRFALRLPPELAGINVNSKESAQNLMGFHFRPLKGDEIAACRSQVWDKNNNQGGAPIDLSRYLTLLTTGTKDLLSEQLTRNKKEKHD